MQEKMRIRRDITRYLRNFLDEREFFGRRQRGAAAGKRVKNFTILLTADSKCNGKNKSHCCPLQMGKFQKKYPDDA